MTHATFVAFSSADQFVSAVIGEACKAASSPEATFIPWNRNDASGVRVRDPPGVRLAMVDAATG
jgi:hypothetical protein